MAIKLKGHETFALREGWLNKGLAKVDANPKVFSENYGADALGVGSNMAKAIRYWLKAGKFMEEPPKEGAKLTDIGQIIFKEDKYLEDIFSLWIFHINLAGNEKLATSWYAFFNLINIDEFSKEDLMNILLEKLFEKKEVDSIGIDELLNSPMSPGRILNLKRMALNEYLDHLEGQGYLTVNRTAGLDMVYLKKKIELKEVVSNYYKKH